MDVSLTEDPKEGIPPVAACSGSSQEENEYLSEDEHIQKLERSGALTQVIGSQSLLSQEIHQQLEGEDDAMGSLENDGVGLSQDVGLSQVSMNSMSSENFDSQTMAHRYGLLSQDPDDQLSQDVEAIDNTATGDIAAGDSQSSALGALLGAVQQKLQDEEEEEQRVAGMFSDDAISNDPVLVIETEETANNHCVQTTIKNADSQFLNDKHNRVGIPMPSLKSSSKLAEANLLLRNDDTAAEKAPVSRTTSNNSKTVNSNSNGNKRKRKDDAEQTKQNELAKRAADLAERTIKDADLAKRLLLSMALVRENPRSAPETLPGKGATLPEGFFWAHYPPLEKVLKDNMAEYYELSVTKCQSAQQQSFNNTLVELVRAEAERQGWLFAPCFTDKSLRDRIRCYYKTHIQNAKKRLRTMIKNPTKRANARHLCAHLDMIEKNVESNSTCITRHSSEFDPNGTRVITHQDWGAAPAAGLGEEQDPNKKLKTKKPNQDPLPVSSAPPNYPGARPRPYPYYNYPPQYHHPAAGAHTAIAPHPHAPPAGPGSIPAAQTQFQGYYTAPPPGAPTNHGADSSVRSAPSTAHVSTGIANPIPSAGVYAPDTSTKQGRNGSGKTETAPAAPTASAIVSSSVTPGAAKPTETSDTGDAQNKKSVVQVSVSV